MLKEKVMKIIFILLSLMLFTIPVKLNAQTATSGKVQKGKKRMISIPVTVSDREGRYISGLKKEDFTIYAGGVEQNIASFASEEEPLSVALLLDTSGSTKVVLDEIKDAAEDFIELMNPKDRGMVATFDSQVKILSAFTSDKKTLKDSLDKLQTAEDEGSVLLRAVEQISQNSFANIQGRKAIVLLSDGKDFGSTVAKNDLLSRLEESDVLIYAVFYQTGKGFNKLTVDSNGTVVEGKENKKPEKKKKPKKKKGYSIVIPLPADTLTEEEVKLVDKVASTEAVGILQEMSDTTAGRFYLSDTPNLRRTFKEIAGELRQQYRLGFYTKDAARDGVVDDISIKVSRADTVVRTQGKFRAKQL